MPAHPFNSPRLSARRSDPSVGGNEQYAEASLNAPERDGLFVAGQLGRGLARDVAGLQRPLLVPDRDRVRIVLVLGLAHECEPAAWVERGVIDIGGPKSHARDRNDAEAWVLPANRLTGRRMDFDPEVLVRLKWAGLAMRFLPVAVHYPEGGVSHFRLGRDNALISWMHTRLFFGMLLRAVPLLRARAAGAAA